MNGIAASDKIFKILDLPVSSDGQYDLDTSFDIRLEHVSFQYDDKRPILKDCIFTYSATSIYWYCWRKWFRKKVQ